MQNLKSLENLNTQPVLGRNDDTQCVVDKCGVEIYSWEAHKSEILEGMDEKHRKIWEKKFATGQC